MEGLLSLVMFLVLVGFYVLPGVVAFMTHRQHAAVITALNVTLGWTLVGWAVTLVWACVDREDPGRRPPLFPEDFPVRAPQGGEPPSSRTDQPR